MNIQIGTSGNIWVCYKDVMGCDVIPYYIILIIIFALGLGFIIGWLAKKKDSQIVLNHNLEKKKDGK